MIATTSPSRAWQTNDNQTTQFAVVLTGDLHPCVGNSLLDQLAKLIHTASPQVPRLVGDLDKIRT
jgi:hypothetical protein